MDLTADVLGAGAVGLLIVFGAVGNYLRNREKPFVQHQQHDPVLAGIGLAYGEKLHNEAMLDYMKRITVALEVLADRRTDEMEDAYNALLKRLDEAAFRGQDRREEQEESEPRRPPPRRRGPG